jgi:hypothetical protein
VGQRRLRFMCQDIHEMLDRMRVAT